MARQFRLREPILGIVPVTHVVLCIPPGAIVDLPHSVPAENRIVDGVWENKPILVFFQDLRNRGDELMIAQPHIPAHLIGRSFRLKVPLPGIQWLQDLPAEIEIPAGEVVSVLHQHVSRSRVVSVAWGDMTLLLFTEDLQQQEDIGSIGAAEV